ncbi:hypothetical protein EXU85_16340 [Spirosoma sp. KCTC 42546]|uniref:hypothetical protein n=1 Tax=Spirosoma sp. KCTC 42546 TaxID=2520506 RepID=UPI0011590F0B|nr:hypothetical protein [Spirosoma sp. KCTC 42546]QDK80090.1 hypothetical protein EXU85_16340 [Spirosoma sp. KCTC 42546]
MKLFILLALLGAFPAWSQVTDSTSQTPFPAKSNFRSGFLMEPGYAYVATLIPTMRSFFRDNHVKTESNLDKIIVAGFGYRLYRFKGMIHSFVGLDQRLLPPPEPAGSNLVARRQNLSGLDVHLGYDVANTRNKRVFINAGVGSIRYEYSLFRTTSQIVPFQTIFQYAPPASVPSLYLTSGYWDVHVEVSQREKRKDTFLWVSRIGYRRGFQPIAWQSEAYQLTDAPRDRISQFYLQLGIYFSRNRLDRRNQ